MQKHKKTFSSPLSLQTITDVQHCLRLNDLNEIGDDTHFLDFYMLGLFSFRHWDVPQTICFWMTFLQEINCIPDTVTIHPDKKEWRTYYKNYPVVVKEDKECLWSDGEIGGYCTEFYRNGVEIGNIVNPLGECIDCGFGVERLQRFLSPSPLPSKEEILGRTISVLLKNNITPSNTKHGYVLRKLIRMGFDHGVRVNHPLVDKEHERVNQLQEKIEKLLKKYPNRPKEFYWETFGVDICEKTTVGSTLPQDVSCTTMPSIPKNSG